MEESAKRFRDLRVWQKGVDLVKEIYTITKSFPSDELYGLTSQMRRAAVSIPSNIAEGFRRKGAKEFKQFLTIALGSCSELETQTVIAHELGYIDHEQDKNISLLIDHVCGMIVNLRKRVL